MIKDNSLLAAHWFNLYLVYCLSTVSNSQSHEALIQPCSFGTRLRQKILTELQPQTKPSQDSWIPFSLQSMWWSTSRMRLGWLDKNACYPFDWSSPKHQRSTESIFSRTWCSLESLFIQLRKIGLATSCAWERLFDSFVEGTVRILLLWQ